MSDRRDVTGIWYGRWTSSHPLVRPNSFIANLREAHARISGSISERSETRGGVVVADVDGARAGGRLEFIKHYSTHAVHYAGTIDAAGTEITGNWRFDRYAGSFAMTREVFDGLDVEEEEEAVTKLPDTVR